MKTFWKHHLISDFEADPKLINNNGTGIGGSCFKSIQAFLDVIGNDYDKYWLCPIKLADTEYIDEGAYVRSLVKRNGYKPFGPYWEGLIK